MDNRERLTAYRDAMQRLDRMGKQLGALQGEQLAALADEYTRQLDELAAQRLEMARIIDTVPDALTRAALRLRFLDGLTWKQTAGNWS